MCRKKQNFRMLTWAAALGAVVSFLIPQCGHAATPADLKKAEQIDTQAKTEYKAGHYDRAADLFMEAYGLSNRLATLYNAARARQQSGKKLETAKAWFELYLRLESTPEGKADAKKRIAEIDALLQAERVQAPPIVQYVEVPVTKPEAAKKTSVVVKPVQAPEPQTATALAFPTQTEKPGPEKEKPFPKVKVISGAGLLLASLGFYLAAYADVTNAVAMLPVHTNADLQAYNSQIGVAQGYRGVAIGTGLLGTTLLTWAAVEYFKN